jgi:hypothetical protein
MLMLDSVWNNHEKKVASGGEQRFGRIDSGDGELPLPWSTHAPFDPILALAVRPFDGLLRLAPGCWAFDAQLSETSFSSLSRPHAWNRCPTPVTLVAFFRSTA